MLKYITEIPVWIINWTNKSFELDYLISHIDSLLVDWVESTYTFSANQLTTTAAPTTTIVVKYFARDEFDMEWNWEVTFWDLIDLTYEEIWRKVYSRIYKRDQIKAKLDSSIWRLFHKVQSRNRLQSFSFKWINWLSVSVDWNSVDISKEDSWLLEPIWNFLVWDGIYYDYYDYDWIKFTVAWDDLIDSWDALLVWTKIPYWVEKISEVYVDWIKLRYVDNREFYINSNWVFTEFKNRKWERYLYLPYSKQEYTCTVKFVPDRKRFSFDNDIVDIDYDYREVPVYEVAYNILSAKEDDRWQLYKQKFNDLLTEYKAFKKSATVKTRTRIKISSPYESAPYRRQRFIRDDLYS